jgi:hypothetical protein
MDADWGSSLTFPKIHSSHVVPRRVDKLYHDVKGLWILRIRGDFTDFYY